MPYSLRCYLFVLAISLPLVLCGCQVEPPAKPLPSDKQQAASPSANVDLKLSPRGRAYIHQPSGIWFRLPEGWTHTEPVTNDRISVLQLEKAGGEVRVTLTWSPLYSSLADAVSTELKTFRELYGDNNVGLIERAEADGEKGWMVRLSAGRDGDVSQHGHICWFEKRVADGAWKFKLRSTYPRDADITLIEELLKQIDWTEREYGPVNQ